MMPDSALDLDRQSNILFYLQAAAAVLEQGGPTSDALGLLLESAANLTGADRAVLFGIDPQKVDAHKDLGELAFLRVTHPMDSSLLAGSEMTQACQVMRQVYASGQAVVNARLDTSDGASDLSPASVLCVSLCAQGESFGIVYLDHPQRKGIFSEAGVKAVRFLAGQAAQIVSRDLLAKRLAEMTQSKAKFVSVVTHELRIPMTSIKGYTEMMQKGLAGPVNEMQGQFLGVIQNNVERMAALVSDLSDLSHAESGRLALKIGPMSVAGAVLSAIQGFKPRFEEKEQTLELQGLEDLPDVFGDPARVLQTLNYLANNAWKYTPAGGKIRLTAASLGGVVRIEVSDSGIGISPDDQACLFTPFFRSDDPDVREHPGWGLSLSVAHQLVTLMQGEIGVDSTLKEGSTFWFTLPAAGDKT